MFEELKQPIAFGTAMLTGLLVSGMMGILMSTLGHVTGEPLPWWFASLVELFVFVNVARLTFNKMDRRKRD